MKLSFCSDSPGLTTFVIIMLFVTCHIGTAGCGGSSSESGRMAVSGKISLDGQPLDEGSIEFVLRGGSGVNAGGLISPEGSYSVAAAKGLLPGEYVVRVFSSEEKGPVPSKNHIPGERIRSSFAERIPADYNVDSKLLVDVTTDGPNTFDFDIQTKK